MADYITDPYATTWILGTKMTYIEQGFEVWTKPTFRGPYHSLKQAQRQAKKQGLHPSYYERLRAAGKYVPRLSVVIYEHTPSLSAVETVSLAP